MRVDILGIGVDYLTRKEALSKALDYIKAGERACRVIFTPNPEIIMAARKDESLAEIMDKAHMVLPDGVGIVWASKYGSTRFKETVPGCDLCHEIFDKIRFSGGSVYLLGAKPGVAETAKANMEKNFPGITVCGFHDGYFNDNKQRLIIDEINSLKPDVLLVGLGSPRQERWIYNNRDNLSVNIAIGCGGTIDIIAGTVKRAPSFFRKTGLEWFYRLISQPTRFFRMIELPKFVIAVIVRRLKSGRL